MAGYVFTAARRAALRKAQLASARKRSAAANARGQGISGLKKNTVPYARVNKRSSTVGVNAGTVIPGTSKRVVLGAYARLESTSKETSVDKALARASGPIGRNRYARLAAKKAGKVVSRRTAGIRKRAGRGEVRLGTSRGAGPTVIYRLGNHKTPQPKSVAGVRRYQNRVTQLQSRKVKKPRPQRRGR